MVVDSLTKIQNQVIFHMKPELYGLLLVSGEMLYLSMHAEPLVSNSASSNTLSATISHSKACQTNILDKLLS